MPYSSLGVPLAYRQDFFDYTYGVTTDDPASSDLCNELAVTLAPQDRRWCTLWVANVPQPGGYLASGSITYQDACGTDFEWVTWTFDTLPFVGLIPNSCQ